MKPMRFLLILASAQVLAAQVTMKQAVENGLRLAASVANQQLEVRGAELERETADRLRLFQATFNAAFRTATDRMEIRNGPIQMAALRDSWDLKLGIVQPLYTGGLLRNAERLQAFRRQAEEFTLEWRRVELAGRIKVSYFTLQLLQSRLRSLQLLRDSLERHLAKLEKYFREELVRRSDVLETQLKRDEIRLALSDLQSQIESEQAAFRTLCGYGIEELEPGYREGDLAPAETRARFEASNPLLLALAHRERMAAAQKRMAGASALPQVAGFAELHWSRPGVNVFARDWSLYLQAGLSVTVPVFNWNRAGRERQLADLQTERIANLRRDLRRETEKGLQQLEAARRAAEAKLEATAQLVAAAEANAVLKEKLYAESQSDNVDYLDAMVAWERYRSQREDLRVQLELIKVNVRTLVGIMGD